MTTAWPHECYLQGYHYDSLQGPFKKELSPISQGLESQYLEYPYTKSYPLLRAVPV